MMKKTLFILCLTTAVGLLFAGCQKASKDSELLRHYSIDSLEGVLTKTGIVFDEEITEDGNGSIRVRTDEPGQVPLFETGDIDVENARLIYQAKVRTEGVEGKVYLEMWCRFPGKGEFFSRALQAPLTGNSDWTSRRPLSSSRVGKTPTM